MSTVVVTGGAGFIGSHLVRKLIGLGHKVHVIDNLSTGKAERVPSGAVLHIHDIRSPGAHDLIGLLSPFAVIHLAAQADVQQSIREPFDDMDVNIGGTLNMLNACRKGSVEKVIFASTSGVYGNLQKDILTEDDPVMPISFYGLSKLTAEMYIRLYSQLFGLPYGILRFANVYGPGQTAKGEGGVVAIFMDRLFTGRPLGINGDGNQTRDFIYVLDVADAIIAAMESKENGTYHVSTGTASTHVDKAHAVGMGVEFILEHLEGVFAYLLPELMVVYEIQAFGDRLRDLAKRVIFTGYIVPDRKGDSIGMGSEHRAFAAHRFQNGQRTAFHFRGIAHESPRVPYG
ncbi:UDP-glucose 4-epimerase 5 [Mortierella sp. GBA39]|nr:UDP-glucose 4-epimerase 5 [Mortierella sp. GBA39]